MSTFQDIITINIYKIYLMIPMSLSRHIRDDGTERPQQHARDIAIHK
jgi:hypothetical protein